MEKLRKIVTQLANTNANSNTPPSQRFSNLSHLQISLIPLLSFASHLYRLALFVRRRLYHYGFFRQHRLPVSVISVGNLTWGGNGKTPMVEFIARCLVDSGVSPLILTRGYSGADEAKMLQRHFLGTSAKIGVGANRAATASFFLEKHGYFHDHRATCSENPSYNIKCGCYSFPDKIGTAILDDGMQHWPLWRDLEIVMVNGLMPWGNCELIPLGPLREPFTALQRADIVVIHHADLAEQNIKAIQSTVWNVKDSIPIFLSKMEPLYFIKAKNGHSRLSLGLVQDMIILCVSAIGFAESFVQTILQMGPKHVDRIDFSDHYMFQTEDINTIRKRLQKLESEFATMPVVVMTEKDYDRDPKVHENLEPYEVAVLCSCLKIIPHEGQTEDSFKRCFSTKLRDLRRRRFE